jgi:hypothetical protein
MHVYTVPVGYGLSQFWVAISCAGRFSRRFKITTDVSVDLGDGRLCD